MGEHQKAKLFTHGGSQAVRLPKAFRFEGSEVKIERDGDRVILQASQSPRSGHGLWDEIDALRGDDQLPYSRQPVIESEIIFD
jgi:antitoxin VapB